MNGGIIERYLRLGLQLDRHVEGTVDAYFGPPDLAAEVQAAAPVDPAALVADAEALLAEVEDGWVRDQIAGLHTFARVVAGETLAYADEVERCYGVRPHRTDEAAFADAHARLEELLPGEGPLVDRYQAWLNAASVSREQLERIVTAVMRLGRHWTSRVVDLPAGEGVALEIVSDKPWGGFCYYLGDLQSRIELNADLRRSAGEVLNLALHETYPGHHAERCVKDDVLVRKGGRLEEAIVLVPTPQSLIAEGIAELAADLVLTSEAGAELATVVADAGVEFDMAQLLEVRRAMAACDWADVNAALMLYEDGASEAEARAYLERWGLITPERSAHGVRFMREPTSRSYIVTYSAGRELCERWVGGDLQRFRRLLTEQVRVGELLAAI
ncbi:MAG TPA: hypothetical protein VFI18_05570 [Gaiellales bacterium]|nr:hypothetical protein [Gaiellales bacterium]